MIYDDAKFVTKISEHWWFARKQNIRISIPSSIQRINERTIGKKSTNNLQPIFIDWRQNIQSDFITYAEVSYIPTTVWQKGHAIIFGIRCLDLRLARTPIQKAKRPENTIAECASHYLQWISWWEFLDEPKDKLPSVTVNSAILPFRSFPSSMCAKMLKGMMFQERASTALFLWS